MRKMFVWRLPWKATPYNDAAVLWQARAHAKGWSWEPEEILSAPFIMLLSGYAAVNRYFVNQNFLLVPIFCATLFLLALVWFLGPLRRKLIAPHCYYWLTPEELIVEVRMGFLWRVKILPRTMPLLEPSDQEEKGYWTVWLSTAQRRRSLRQSLCLWCLTREEYTSLLAHLKLKLPVTRPQTHRLQAGERILWEGRPQPRAFSRGTVFSLIFGLFFAGAPAFLWYQALDPVYFHPKEGETLLMNLFPILFSIPFVLATVITLLMPLWSYLYYSRTRFIVTTRRAVEYGTILNAGSVYKDEICEPQLKDNHNGTFDVVYEMRPSSLGVHMKAFEYLSPDDAAAALAALQHMDTEAASVDPYEMF